MTKQQRKQIQCKILKAAIKFGDVKMINESIYQINANSNHHREANPQIFVGDSDPSEDGF